VRRQAAQFKHLETKLEKIAQTLASKHDRDTRVVSDISFTPLHTVADVLDDPARNGVQSLLPHDSRHVATTEKLNPPSTVVSGSEISATSVHESDMLLDRYKRLMAPNMPFVVLPTDTSASDLARTEPFLLHAIQVVASFHDTCYQQALGMKLTFEICERLLINGEKSLGLLQGLLVFTNWYNPHLYFPKNSANLLHLAIALTTDLGIDRGPGNCEKAQMETAMRAYGVAQPAKTLTNDERRAVLGTFYLTSLIFTSFRKVDVLRWTPWLKECANTLSEAQEYESDSSLLQLVHMQRVMQEAMAIESNRAPCQLYANSFLKDLDLLSSQTAESTLAPVIRLQDACTRIAIWQRSFTGLASDVYDSDSLRQRLDGMWKCMEAVKVYIDLYMTIPVDQYLKLPFRVFAQFAYAFVVTIRALCVDMDGWDAQSLHGLIDFSTIIEEVSRRYEAVSLASVDGLSCKNEAFSKLGGKLRWAKTFHDARLASVASDIGPGQTVDQTSGDVQIPIGAGPTRDLLTAADISIDPLLESFEGFEDFWNVFSDPSQLPMDSGNTFGNM
jgi:hypothetical protein